VTRAIQAERHPARPFTTAAKLARKHRGAIPLEASAATSSGGGPTPINRDYRNDYRVPSEVRNHFFILYFLASGLLNTQQFYMLF
tara:strand:+ start:407 stop:661 length:255 start_codon:yes stop_codon:yes gene_type:complete